MAMFFPEALDAYELQVLSWIIDSHIEADSCPAACLYPSVIREASLDVTALLIIEPVQVHSVVSKMMIDGILSGSWDQPTASIVMHDIQPTKLQDLAANFTEKAGVLVDLNERALQLRTGAQRGDGDEESGRFQENSSFNQRRCYHHPQMTRTC